jgi:hypothetical protein
MLVVAAYWYERVWLGVRGKGGFGWVGEALALINTGKEGRTASRNPRSRILLEVNSTLPVRRRS